MLDSYLNYIQETIYNIYNYNKEVYKISARIPIKLYFDPTMIKKWGKWKPVTEELSYQRFKQYKNYFKDINKYLVALDKVTRMKISNVIKQITIFVIADKRTHNYSGIGRNLTSSPNKSHIYIALGIESKPHALVYFCHELGHSLILIDKTWNKEQLELYHMMIEYFTDWSIWNVFNKGKNIFVTEEHRERFNKLIDKEYGKSKLDANKFITNMISRYKEYDNYIKIRK